MTGFKLELSDASITALHLVTTCSVNRWIYYLFNIWSIRYNNVRLHDGDMHAFGWGEGPWALAIEGLEWGFQKAIYNQISTIKFLWSVVNIIRFVLILERRSFDSKVIY